MIINDLQVSQFRNIRSFSWQPHARANLLIGANAQGKTNLLEAIYLLGTTKSLRPGASSDDLIMAGQDQALVKGSVQRESPVVSRELEVRLKRDEARQVRLNGKPLTPFSKIFGQLTVVLFVPEDLGLVKAGPAARRQYLDLEISQATPLYLEALQTYQRALRQRNAAIRMVAEGRAAWSTVEAFDASLVESGSEIIRLRAEAIEELQPLAAQFQARVAGHAGEDLQLRYLCSVEEAATEKNIDAIRDAFARALKARASEERGRSTTLSGPHRDDLEINLEGRPARLFASQGQQRTTALALKLAEVQFLSRRLHENPVLLLDDVLSELDLDRQSALLGLLDEHVQTFVTSTHAEGLAYKPGEVLKVTDGEFFRAS
ncbi:MAG: DNA replication/repair protein RecF [candidate division FCPU426 bacterium]